MPQLHSPKPPRPVQQFNAAIHVLLKANNAEARSMLAYINRLLHQYNLQGRFSVIDIFVIAYLRGVEQLLKPEGKSIQKPKAWMRGAILNVIREQNRSLRKEYPLLWEVADRSTERIVDDSVIEESFDVVVQAFNQLSDQERKIIKLKKIDGKSWTEVLIELNEPLLTLPALRKRGQRAFDKLRTEYHNIKPPVYRDDDMDNSL